MKEVDLPDRIRKLIHPLLLKAMSGRRDFPIEILNDMPEVQGNKLFAINHSCVLDAPISSEVIKEHFYLLVGRQSLEILDRIFFFLNGVVYVDRKDKTDKRRAFVKMLKILQEGKNLVIYPEGTWNLTPSKPMLPLILEYHSNCCYAKYGAPIYINKEMNKQSGIEQLEEAMSTLKWDIWEMFTVQKRTDEMKAEFEEMIQRRVAEYPKFNYEYEMSVVRGRENAPECIMGR